METVVRVFDIPEFFQEEATDERKNDFALELIAAFTNVGFIYVRSDTVTEEELLAVNSVSLQYFNESLELKQLLLSRDRAKRGYSPFGTENFASLVGEIKPNDLVEKLRVGPEFDHSDTYYSTKLSRSHFSENIWNESFPTLRSVVTRYYHSMEILALQILEIIGYGLGYTAQYFEKKMDKHTSILTINHYPKNSSSLQSDRVRVAEHTDVSMITIVNQCPPTSCQSDYGLQILSSELEWVDVPHIPGCLIVNVGDCLSNWSGNRLISTRHRVISGSSSSKTTIADPNALVGEERISSAYFLTPNYDAIVDYPESSTSATYDGWRRSKIKSAMKVLKGKYLL